MSSSAINQSVFQAKVSGIQNQADSTSIYSNGVWSFKNSTALTSVTITDAGNVGVGATTTSAKLTIKNPSATGEQQIINIQSAASTDAIAKVTFNQTTDALNIANFTNIGALVFGTGGSGTERMRIDSSGNVGIGTASPSFAAGTGLAINGGAGQARLALKNNSTGDATTDGFQIALGTDSTVFLEQRENSPVVFSTNNTERMRIDASGNLQVGLTSGSRKVNVSNSDSGGLGVIYGDNPNAANSGVGVFTTNLGSGNGAQNNTNCWHFRGVTANVGIWYLYGNGTHSFTSDQRLKKNIEPARDGYVEDLCKLRVVKYHWNTNEDSEAKELGLIAQEVEQVFPGLVQEADVEFEGGLKPKVLKGSVLPFMLLKAIQEQQSMIESMKAEIEALKAK